MIIGEYRHSATDHHNSTARTITLSWISLDTAKQGLFLADTSLSPRGIRPGDNLGPENAGPTLLGIKCTESAQLYGSSLK
jgi:hypothetical protein